MTPDPLLEPLAELCGAFHGLQEQVKHLVQVHDAVDDFNSTFGTFQWAMALHASCLSYPEGTFPSETPPSTRGLATRDADETNASEVSSKHTRETQREGSRGDQIVSQSKRERAKQEETKLDARAATGAKRPGKAVQFQGIGSNKGKRRKMPSAKATAPAWTWERHIREKIPRKYQSPAELKKLENIVLYLKNRHCAISISDLVKHSGLPVIRCKEILQTLMKLNLVERKHEKSVRFSHDHLASYRPEN
ncbi:hypothetical protein PsorP6_000910 [Peronosclerospora sorghi]|uniref:Uncharacterized protein n=1 Tax=Peronosclerospora sorghi TaxID=230839 RepID=A0ACC0WU26_9STRA|nr:hypothetical protein PsorP6_000910 [Peronosclerospora sorghi]